MTYQPTAEDIAKFKPIMEIYNAKFMGMPQEAQAKMGEVMAKVGTDPELKAKEMATWNELFEKADADKDGKHNLAETIAVTKMSADCDKEKYGGCMEFTDDEMKVVYDIYNTYSEGDGVH